VLGTVVVSGEVVSVVDCTEVGVCVTTDVWVSVVLCVVPVVGDVCTVVVTSVFYDNNYMRSIYECY
jgi:hypothetical protein